MEETKQTVEPKKKKSKGKKALKIIGIIIASPFVLYFVICLVLLVFEPASPEVELAKLEGDPGFIGYNVFDESKNDKLYIKQVTADDVSDIPKTTNMLYVNNTVNIIADENASYADIEKLADENKAKISGYIESIGFYQLEYTNSTDYKELLKCCDELEESALVAEAATDCFEHIANEYIPPADKNLPDSIVTQSFDIIKEELELDKAKSFVDSTDTVNVGIIDGCADYNNELLNVKNSDDYSDIALDEESVVSDNTHGTHVAGIISAKATDKNSFAGVCEGAPIYSYYARHKDTAYWIASICKMITEQEVKVINVSWGNPDEILVSASCGNKNAIAFNKEQAAIMEHVLKRLINQGYEFVICEAAGNSNSVQLYRCFGSYFGYGNKNILGTIDLLHWFGKSPIATKTERTDSSYAFYFSQIENPVVKDRVIVVGAEDLYIQSEAITYGEIDTSDTMAFYSDVGDRVDIIAPGKTYSTVLNNCLFEAEGTSMATPFVTGTAAAVFAVNENLTGAEVKQIIVDSATDTITDEREKFEYPVLNTGAAVEKAQTIK